MSTTPTVTTSKATVPFTKKSAMRIASASDYLGDGIDTLLEEAVQYFDGRMIGRFPEIEWEGESSKLARWAMILGIFAEKGLARRVNEKGKWVWKSTTRFIRDQGPAARELQPAPARLQARTIRPCRLPSATNYISCACRKYLTESMKCMLHLR